MGSLSDGMADALKDKTLEDLREIAADLDIDGRSNLKKDELVAAIATAQGDANPGAPAAKEAAEAAKDVEPDEEAEEFPVERLVQESQDFLGVPRHVAAGALSGVNKQNLTVEEADAAVKTFLKAEVSV